jgi:ubiquinone/menaquinone biosynthesis C-methylase UbiE
MWRAARHYDGLLADRKRSLLSAVGGTVVEIGPGTGTNFRYYRRNIHWIGVEPNRYMHPYLQRAAEAAGLPIEVLLGSAENLSLADESADAVVATAVLCSVRDPRRALQEIRRVLKPGGRFIFVEHVAAERGTALRRIQRIIQPLWSCMADGCHPDRDTSELIGQAGLRPLVLDGFRLPLGPVAPHIAGVAVRH